MKQPHDTQIGLQVLVRNLDDLLAVAGDKRYDCEGCGLVIHEQRIDHGPEWRTHDQDQRKRTGAPLTAARHD